MVHKHSVYDTDTHFSINPITRALKNEASGKTCVIQYDHNSERFTFEIPRYIDGHDMSTCNEVQIHYLNINPQTKEQKTGVYSVDDLQISPEGNDVVILSWLISGNATQLVGSLNFLIRFACVTDGNVDYVWNTAIYTGISVSSGIYNGDIVVEEYADILAQWGERITALERASGSSTNEQIAQAVEDYFQNNPINAGAKIVNGSVELKAEKWVSGGEQLWCQVVDIPGVTAYSQVDLTPSVEQLAIFRNKDIAFVAGNNGGVVTVYAIGQKPTNDYTMQITMKEVVV